MVSMLTSERCPQEIHVREQVAQTPPFSKTKWLVSLSPHAMLGLLFVFLEGMLFCPILKLPKVFWALKISAIMKDY